MFKYSNYETIGEMSNNGEAVFVTYYAPNGTRHITHTVRFVPETRPAIIDAYCDFVDYMLDLDSEIEVKDIVISAYFGSHEYEPEANSLVETFRPWLDKHVNIVAEKLMQ